MIADGEKLRRTHLAIWAYAYEFESVSLVSDDEFDKESRRVNLDVDTDRPHLDAWFRNNFEPDTGMWIHQHPELDRVKRMAQPLIQSARQT